MKVEAENLKIRPCPLCGSVAFLHKDHTASKDFFWVKCDDPRCGCTFNTTNDQAKTLASWNRRP